ncbi:MAG: dethiobiotin synthase [Cyclobacteriaceae bacterium]
MNYFVTAIGTDSGKTVASAILVEALGADYWKPVQAGFPTDTAAVRFLVSNLESTFFPERYLLQTPASPHAAAIIDEVEIRLSDFELPGTFNDLIIEGAGGALVPINDQDYVIDLADKLDAEVVVVADLYLGSINHTLLTVEALKNRKLKVKGIIFNGESNPESERIILQKSGWKKLLHIQKEDQINPETITKYAALLNENWQ